MSLDRDDYNQAQRGSVPHFEVVVSTDGGNSYVRYFTGGSDLEEAREQFDHHCHEMREAMRIHGRSEAIVELLNNENVLEAVTLRQRARYTEAHAERATLATKRGAS